jgi:hypothetical protein
MSAFLQVYFTVRTEGLPIAEDLTEGLPIAEYLLYSNHSFRPLSLIRSLKKNKIFSYIMIYDDCYKKDIKHWYMTETLRCSRCVQCFSRIF